MSTFLICISWSISIGYLLWAMEVPQWIEKNILKNPQEQYRRKIEELEERIKILENRNQGIREK